MNIFVKKIGLLFITLLFFSFFLFLLFPKKITQEKIQNKINQTVDKIEEVKETIIPIPTKILETGLPNYHLIKTAFIPQAPEKNWDQPWQDACEESALLTGFYYYNEINPTIPQIRDKVLEIIDYETKQGWGTSINLSKVKQIYDDYLGLNSEIIINPTIDDIKNAIIKNNPVFVPAAGKIIFKENKYFKNGGPEYHALTILGFDDSKQQFIVHDVGTQYGAYFKYSYNLLMESIHDFPESNNKKDILLGSKKILVLKSL